MNFLKARFLTTLSLCFALLLTPFWPLPASSQEKDQADFHTLVKRLFAAYQKEDLNELFSLWSERSSELAASKQMMQQTFASYEKIEIRNIEFRRVLVETDRAKVLVTAEMSAVNAGTGAPADGLGKVNRTITLVKEAGTWKVWQFASSEEDLAAEMIAAQTDEGRKALLAQYKELVTEKLVASLYKQGKALSDRGEYQDALAIYDLSLNLAKQLGDDAGTAITFRLIGNIHLLRADYPRALDYFQQSLKITERLRDRAGNARTLTNMGVVFESQGDYPKALEYYQESLKIQTELEDKAGIHKTLVNIGILYGMQGDHPQSLDYFNKSLKLAEELGDKAGVADALINIGVSFAAQGDHARALENYQNSLRLQTELEDKVGLVRTLVNIGNLHFLQGNDQQALEYYQRSLKIQEELEDKAVIIVTLNNIGTVFESQGDYAQALEHYRRSMELAEQLGQKDGIATALNNFGIIKNLQGKDTEALDFFQKSLKIEEELEDKESVAEVLVNIAETYLTLKRYTAVIEMTERASALASQSNVPGVLWKARTTAGKAYMALNKYDLARQAFLEAISIIEKLREQVAGGEQDRMRFFENKVSPYQAMVELSIAQQNLSQALTFAERAKGRVLLDVLSQGRINITKAITESEIEKDRALTNEITSLNTQILHEQMQSPTDQARLVELNARLNKARLAYESYQTDLYAAHPELKVKRGEMRQLSLTEVAELLPDDKTAVLEYVVTKDKSYLFVVTKAAGTAKRNGEPVSLAVYPLNVKGKELAEMVEDFRQRVAERNLTVKGPARHLYDLLIKPAEKQLQNITKLCIVPDASLWDLPFQALYRKEGQYLLEQHAIFYAPSLSVLGEMVKRGSELRSGPRQQAISALNQKPDSRTSGNDGPELLALGNPVLDRQAVSSIGSIYREEGFSPLPEAEREVNVLGQMYGRARSRILTKSEAREEVVKSEAGKYKILHFAAHAILDDRNPMYSRIMFSQVGRGAGEDGMLEAWEIMRLDLMANMVILSACQTARGRVGEGEGMIGFSWALFVAGCPNVLVSQWKVDSARTADLMIDFHQNLLAERSGDTSRMTKAEALRKAALKLLKGPYNHPAYWAGFVLIGDEQ